MATEVSSNLRDSQPYSCIGLIWATFPDGTLFSGTCTLVGRNDILTATHMVYSPDNGGWAKNFDFYFGADYNNITNRFEDYGYSYLNPRWKATAWPDQTFADDDNNTLLPLEIKHDIAMIGVADPIGDTLGWLGLDSGYNGSYSANSVGYPDGTPGMMRENVFVRRNSYSEIYHTDYTTLGKGSSGGPLLIGNNVIGVKSAGSENAGYWADVGTLFSHLADFMESNDSMLGTDTNAPTVAIFNPSDGATGVPTTANIVITFNEPIARGTGTIDLWNSLTGIYVETFDAATSSRLKITDSILTIDPVSDFAYSTGYYVIFHSGNIKDLSGNSYAGTYTYDFITESSPNVLGTLNNDTLIGGNGVPIDGLAGIDTVIYFSNFSSITHNPNGTWTVGADSLTNIERLQFADKKLALDLGATQNGGQAVKFIGTLAYPLAKDAGIFGLILDYFDQGHTLSSISDLAVNIGLTASLAGSGSNADLANLVFHNVVGGEADAATTDMLVGFMDGRHASYTQGEFVAAVADLELNQEHVGLVGLHSTGLEYF